MNKTQKAHLLVLAFGKMCVPRCVSYTTRRELLGCMVDIGLPCWLSGKESACQCRRRGFDPWVKRSKWQPTPFSCLENPMERGAWWATAHGVARVGHD